LFLLVVAQYVPTALLGPRWLADTEPTAGIRLTIGGWADAIMADDWLAFVGWTANLWMVATLLACLLRRRNAALCCALIGMVCAVIGVLSLYLSEYILAISVGPFIWCGSFFLIAAAMNEWEAWRVEAVNAKPHATELDVRSTSNRPRDARHRTSSV
jgi:hypothetical protein